MMGQKVSIIIPVIRTENIDALIKAIHLNAGIPRDEYEIVMDVDRDRIGCPKMTARLVEKSRHDLVCFLGDDTIPKYGFLKKAIEAMDSLPDGWGLVGLNDGSGYGKKRASHWLAHKKLLSLTGGYFFNPEYKHCFCDQELTDIAIDAGRYTWCEESKIVHNHPLNKNEEPSGEYAKLYEKGGQFRDDYKTYLRRKCERNEFKLGICLPIVDNLVYRQFFASFTAMRKPSFSLYLPVNTIPGFADDIAHIRNDLAYQAIQDGCTHIAFMDTDQIYPEDALEKILENDVDICGAVVHRRYPPFDPVMYRGELGKYTHVTDEEMYSGKLCEVSATGTGFLVIKSKIFFDVEPPWFKIVRQDDGKTIGEDIYFCNEAVKRGWKIFVDTRVEAGHLALTNVNRQMHQLFKKLNKFEWRQQDGI